MSRPRCKCGRPLAGITLRAIFGDYCTDCLWRRAFKLRLVKGRDPAAPTEEK